MQAANDGVNSCHLVFSNSWRPFFGGEGRRSDSPLLGEMITNMCFVGEGVSLEVFLLFLFLTFVVKCLLFSTAVNHHVDMACFGT